MQITRQRIKQIIREEIELYERQPVEEEQFNEADDAIDLKTLDPAAQKAAQQVADAAEGLGSDSAADLFIQAVMAQLAQLQDS